MTDVGKVTVGVEVNASDLGAELAAKIERAVRPAIAAVNRQLDELNRKVQNLDSNGLDRITAKARTAAEAIQSVGHASRDASLMTGRAVNSQIRDYQRLADAAERAANRQIAAAARVNAAQAAMNRTVPGAGGGGGGGPRRPNSNDFYMGGARGSRWTGGGGLGGFLASPVGVNTIALLLGQLPALSTAVVQVTGAVQQLAGGLFILPGAFAAIGSSVGVAILGFEGMGKAVKQFWQAFQDGDPKSLEKANELIKNWAPNAQSAVRSVASLFPQLQALRQLAQQNMFAGLDSGIKRFADQTIPTASKGIDQISRVWNRTLQELLKAGGSADTQGFLTRIFGNTADAQTRLNQAIQPFVHAMGTLAAAGSDALPRLATILGDLINRFDKFISGADADGRLDKWINGAITGFQHVIEIVLNLGKVIGNLTGAAGGDFLGWLERVTDRWVAWTGSVDGQNKLSAFFKEGSEQLRRLGEFLKPLATDVFPAIIEACARWADILMPFLTAASQLLGAMPGLVQSLVLGFIALRTISPFKGILTDLGLLNSGLATAQQRAAAVAGGGVIGGGGRGGLTRGQRFRAGAADFGRNAGIIGGASIGIQGAAGGNDPLSWLEAVGGGAITGASIGSLGGPIGAAIGGGVGAALGAAIKGVTELLNSNADAARKAADEQTRLADAMKTSAAATETMRNAQKNMLDSFLESNGQITPEVVSGIAEKIEAIPDSLASKLKPEELEGVRDAINKLGLSSSDMAEIVARGGPQLDALINNLKLMGPNGAEAAGALSRIAGQLGALQGASVEAAPLMQRLAQVMGTDVAGAAVAVQNAFMGIPKNVPIDMSMPNAPAVLDILRNVGAQIDIVDGKPVLINAQDASVQEALIRLESLGIKITTLPGGNIQVQLDPTSMAKIDGDMRSFFEKYGKLTVGVDILPGQQIQYPPGTIAPGDLGGLLGAPPGAAPPQGPVIVPAIPGYTPPRRDGGIVRGYDGGGQVRAQPIDPSVYAWLVARGIITSSSPGNFNPGIKLDTSNVTTSYPNSSVPFVDLARMGMGLPPIMGGPFEQVGGMLPGYSPGVDNMLVPLSGGEGIIIPEAMRALGPEWLYGINSQFRSGLSRQGYAGGGVFRPFLPWMSLEDMAGSGYENNDPALAELKRISSLLAGTTSGPLTDLRQATKESIETGGLPKSMVPPGTTPGRIGPFGTPIKPRNAQYDMLSSIIRAFGGDPTLVLGENPIDYANAQWDQIQNQLKQANSNAGVGSISGYNLWDEIAKAESSGDWANNNSGGHMTSSGAPRGGLQITDGTWRAFGGTEFAPTANLATREQQIAVAKRIAFEGYKGTAPQGLGAWEVITQGKVPGVTVNTPASAFQDAASAAAAQQTPTTPAPWAPGVPGVPGAPTTPLAPGQAPPPGAVWVPGVNSWMLNGVMLGGTAPAPGAPTSIPAAGTPPTPPLQGPPIPGQTAPLPQAPQRPNGPAPTGMTWDYTTGKWVPAPGTPGATPAAAPASMPTGAGVDTHGANAYLGGIFAAIKQQFPGLQITAGKDDHSVDRGYHPKGQALDIAGDPAQMAALANWLTQFAPSIQQLIHKGPGVTQNILNGKLVPAIDMPGSPYTTAEAGDHSTHDHLAVTPEQAQALYSALTGGGALPPGSFAPGSTSGFGGSLGLGGGGGVVPVYVVGGNLGGGGQGAQAQNLWNMIKGPVNSVTNAAGGVVGDVGNDVIQQVPGAVADVLGPNFNAPPGTPNAQLSALVKEGNPMALPALAGFDVPDMSRNGQVGFTANDIQRNDQQFDATGRLISNTSGLVQRSFTDLTGQMQAMRVQLVSATRGVSEKLASEAIGPVFQSGVTDGISSIPNIVMANLGSEIGQAAAPQIADAVASSSSPGGSSAQAVAAAPVQGLAAVIPMASGGGVTGGQAGKDSVPAMLMPGEWVVPAHLVSRMGGFPGMQRFTSAVSKHGGIKHFAAGGGVIGNDTVGADWFGVSQVPVIGTIVNLIIRVLLGVLGVQIKVRDTLSDVTDDFRTFRGEIQQFNATGRLMNDTSGLAERSQSSEQTVANERIRILKIVIEALIKYIIEKVIVPLTKAVLNAALQAGSTAAGAAINSQAPGAGGVAQSFINALGSAGIDIGAQIGSDIAVNLSSVLVDMIGSGAQSVFPGLVNGLLGGNVLGGLLNPIGGVLGGIITLPLALLSMLLGTVGGEASWGNALMGGVFDNGGIAHGTGLMPKAVIEPERVLNPSNTASFDRLVELLASGAISLGGGNTTVHAPISLTGSSVAAEDVRDSVLSLMTR